MASKAPALCDDLGMVMLIAVGDADPAALAIPEAVPDRALEAVRSDRRGSQMIANHGLVEDIREYWSHRAETFDRAFGHGIAPGQEAAAWARPMREHLGPAPRRVLELACGTGEVTRLYPRSRT